jgi:hypothetical protein
MTYVDGTVCLTSDERVTTNCVLQRIWIDALGPISFGAFPKQSRRETISFVCLSNGLSTSPPVRQCVCPSVHPSARNNSALIQRTSITFYTRTCDFTNVLEHIGPIPILFHFGQKFPIHYIKNYAPFNTCAVFVCEAGCTLCGGRAEAKNIFNITEIMFSVTCGLRMKQLILGNWALSMVIFET